jgi:hypothetical protein
MIFLAFSSFSTLRTGNGASPSSMTVMSFIHPPVP